MIINCIPHKDKEPPRIVLLLSNSQNHDMNGQTAPQAGGGVGNGIGTGNKGGSNGSKGGGAGGTGGSGSGGTSKGESNKDDSGGLTVRIKAEGFRLAGA